MRAFWLRAFKRRPDVPWPEFWACFPRDLATPAAAELRMMFLSQSARDALQARSASGQARPVTEAWDCCDCRLAVTTSKL